MNIEFKIDEKFLTHSGKPSIIWQCADCGHVYHHLTSWLFQAKLQHSPKQMLHQACEEFVTALNQYNTDLFIKAKTGNKLRELLCYCSLNVVDLEFYRRKHQALSLWMNASQQ